jgi:membrane-associated protein
MIARMDILAALLDLVVHLDLHLGEMARAYGTWVYAIIFLIVFCETGLVIAPFLPGDSLLFVAGGIWAASDMNVHGLAAVIVVAAFCGDNVNYAVGRFIGPRVLREGGRLLNQAALERTQLFYQRHGGKAVIVARFMPFARTFAPFVAGVGRMHYPRYIAFSVLASLLWVGSLVYAGYYFGNVPAVKKHFSLLIVGVIALSFAPLIFGVLRRRFARAPTRTR